VIQASNSDAIEDAEANHFAMCLLMPRAFVEQEVRAMGGVDVADDAQMRVLARRFGVPVTLMAMRLGQLAGGRVFRGSSAASDP